MFHYTAVVRFIPLALKSSAFNLHGISFTAREKDILASMLSGRSFKSIAALLSLSPKTVETHTRNIFQKMHINCREDAINQMESSPAYEELKKHYLNILRTADKEKYLSLLQKFYPKEEATFCIFTKGSSCTKELAALFLKDLGKLGIGLEKVSIENLSPYALTLTPFPQESLDTFLVSTESPSVDMEGSSLINEAISYEQCLFEILKTKTTHPEALKLLHQFLSKHRGFSPESSASGLPQAIKNPTSLPLKNVWRWGSLIVGCILLMGILSFSWKNSPSLSNLYLPPKNKLLIRQTDLVHIESFLKNNKDSDQNPVVAIVGIGGSGKTTLARVYAQSHTPHLVWELDSQSASTLLQSFESLASRISDVDPSTRHNYDRIIETFTGRERSLKLLEFVKDFLRNHSPWILIYDDLKEDFGKIEPLLLTDQRRSGKGAILITTRDANINLTFPESIFEIPPLNPTEKEVLFKKAYQGNGKTKAVAGQEVDTLLETLPPFPLDISVAAHYLQMGTLSSEKYLEGVKKPSSDFMHLQNQVLAMVGDYTHTRQNIINLSLKQMIQKKKEFKEMLFFVSFLNPTLIPKQLFIESYGEAQVDDFLYHLKKYSFITAMSPPGQGATFSIHESCKDQFLSYFQTTMGKKEYEEHVKKNIILFNKLVEKNCETPRTQTEFLMEKILMRQAKSMLSHTTSVKNAEKEIFKKNVGSRCMHIGEFHYAEQLLLENIETLKTEKASSSLCDSYASLGMIYVFLGDVRKAKKFLSQSMEAWNHTNPLDLLKKGRLFVLLAAMYRQEGHLQKAIHFVKEGLKIFESRQDGSGVAWAKGYLGFIYNEEGRYTLAEPLLQEALSYYKKIGNVHKCAWISHHLGYTFLFTHRYKEALEILTQGYAYFKKAYGKEYVNSAWMYGLIGLAHGFLGDTSKARIYLNYTYNVFKQHFGEKDPETATILQYKGIVEFLDHHLEKAQPLLQQSLILLKESRPFKAALSQAYLKKFSSML